MENFKEDILGTLSSQLDKIKTKMKQDEENAVLSIFCSKCRKRNPLREFLLNVVSICGSWVDNHFVEDCPSFPGLQAIFKQGMKQSIHLYNPHKKDHGNPKCRSHKSLHHNNTYPTILTPHNVTLKCF